jgi:TPR repeat protein
MGNEIPIEMMVAATGGDSFAQFDVAVRYLRGDGVTQDYAKAYEWLTKAAEQGHSRAQFNLGSIHLKGIGVPEDAKQAFQWYEKAVEGADPELLFNIGEVVEHEQARFNAWPFAVKCYRAAADAGHAKAQVTLGIRLLRGLGVEERPDVGEHYIREAARQGEPKALYILAKMYEEGFGREPDAAEAVYLLYLAALEGHPAAQAEGRALAETLNEEQQKKVGERISATMERLKSQAAAGRAGFGGS